MYRVLALVTFAACACAGAAEPVAGPDIAKGQAVVNQVCVACHGLDGNSALPVNPKLAAQIPDYLRKQMMNFKAAQGAKAERDNPVMAGMVAALSPEDMRNVAAYYGRQQLKPGTAKNKDTLDLGRKLWRAGDASKGVPACAGCHGASGAGVPAQYPRLAGQFAEYTEAQLKAFRVGQRANDANKVMRTIAIRMSDAEIGAVADYAAGLR